MTIDETAVLGALNADSGTYVDDIAMQTGMKISETLATLTMLELKGRVRQMSGKRFILAV